MRIAAEEPAANRGVTRRTVLGGGLALTLAGCNSAGLEMPNDFGGAPAPAPAAPPVGGALVGEALGTGPVRVGMILPLTQNGGPGPIGVSMRNAAQLAIDDSRVFVHHADGSGRPFKPRRRRPRWPNRSSARARNSSSDRYSPTTCEQPRRRRSRRAGR